MLYAYCLFQLSLTETFTKLMSEAPAANTEQKMADAQAAVQRTVPKQLQAAAKAAEDAAFSSIKSQLDHKLKELVQADLVELETFKKDGTRLLMSCLKVRATDNFYFSNFNFSLL
jgi:hypothetical protein